MYTTSNLDINFKFTWIYVSLCVVLSEEMMVSGKKVTSHVLDISYMII